MFCPFILAEPPTTFPENDRDMDIGRGIFLIHLAFTLIRENAAPANYAFL